MLDCADGHERPLVFEMANESDTGNIKKQIDHYVEALEEEAIEVAVGVKGDDSYRVLFVFEHVRTFEYLKKRLADDLRFQEWSNKFFCKPREWLETEPFRASWLRLAKDGAPPSFLVTDIKSWNVGSRSREKRRPSQRLMDYLTVAGVSALSPQTRTMGLITSKT